jgi:hypothetical protein
MLLGMKAITFSYDNNSNSLNCSTHRETVDT